MNSASELLHYFLDSRSVSAFAFLKIQRLLRAINHSWGTPKREIVFFVCSSRRALYKYKLRNYGACIGYAGITHSASDLTSLNRCLLGVTSQFRFNKLIYCSLDVRQCPLRKKGLSLARNIFRHRIKREAGIKLSFNANWREIKNFKASVMVGKSFFISLFTKLSSNYVGM